MTILFVVLCIMKDLITSMSNAKVKFKYICLNKHQLPQFKLGQDGVQT